MIIARYTQGDGETKIYEIDYSEWLTPGETLTSSNAVPDLVTTPPLLTSTTLTLSITSVNLTVSGGLADSDYIVKVTVSTSNGQIKEDCVEFSVRDACG